MHLVPRDHDRLLLSQAGFLAQRRLARGVQLNQTEAIALIATQLQERIRDGIHSVAQLMAHGKQILGRRHVLPSVPSQIHQIQVEGTFHDGVFLVTVHDPICTEDGDIEAALYASFLPIPPDSAFPPHDPSEYAPEKQPGAIVLHKSDPYNGRITINKGRRRVRIRVTNNGDRPIQVGSHYHFLETNPLLSFDRALAYAKRLDIPAGTAVRFEPGDTRTVSLIPISGRRIVSGGNDLSSGPYNPSLLPHIIDNLIQQGFAHVPEPGALDVSTDTEMEREAYASMYGPTTGDRIRLGDTKLWIEIEWDEGASVYGEEVKFGGGKTIREGMAQATNRSSNEVMDLVLTNAVIIDWQGIYKADIGIKNGQIAGIGKAGNPDISSTPLVNGSSKSLIPIGSSTEILSCENLIVTAGTIDVHVHYICPQQITEALASGTTTFIGGGTGPADGTKATTCTSSEFYLAMMMRACDKLPGNFGFTGKGNDAGCGKVRCSEGNDDQDQEGECKAIEEIIKAGACGLKLHEDWGSTPSSIRRALSLAEKYDVQVNIHTDTLNESGFVEQTIKAFEGRTIHTYHTEGAGGGHAPDVIRLCGEANVLPSSTNPTRPFARNTLDEHLDMLMVCHHLSRQIPEDISFAESRIRGETVAAEDVLHDLGALSMISSDSQAMGRIAEVAARTWRTASKMRQFRGPLTSLGDSELNDNARVKRYISKYTINPAITHGISHVVGDISVGKMADLVGWQFGRFGSSSGPEWVVKGGVVVWAQMGDANASVPTVEPSWGRAMWGAVPGFGTSSRAEVNGDVDLKGHHSAFFISGASLAPIKPSLSNPSGLSAFETYNLSKPGISVRSCRNIKKGDMKWNGEVPRIEVDPETYDVKADGVRCDVEPAVEVCLGRGYNLF